MQRMMKGASELATRYEPKKKIWKAEEIMIISDSEEEKEREKETRTSPADKSGGGKRKRNAQQEGGVRSKTGKRDNTTNKRKMRDETETKSTSESEKRREAMKTTRGTKNKATNMEGGEKKRHRKETSGNRHGA